MKEETPKTNRIFVMKGLRYLFGALPLMIIGPIVIFSSFKNQAHPLYYFVLVFGCIVAIVAILLFFLGIKTIMKGLFNE